MQNFHQKIKLGHYKNDSHVAVDWPHTFEHAGKTYLVALTGTSKSFPTHVSPTSIWLLITAGHGYSLTYFVQTSSPCWLYIEQFIAEEIRYPYDKMPEHIKSVFTVEEQAALEETFLGLTTYIPVTINDWKGGSIEDLWNPRTSYTARKEQLSQEASERDLYGGKTWQEYQDDL